ncbi:MAG TPA: hypothetical protein VMV69_18360 [Pirellulales bacterium]|nr:hypothetical protein [Pirellulales bacterium]
MTTISIVPDGPLDSPNRFRAVAGDVQSVGATVGEAADALRAQLSGPDQTTLILVQPMHGDGFFTLEQQQRLGELTARWRTARDSGTTFPPEEQAQLNALVEAELQAAGERSAALLRGMPA